MENIELEATIRCLEEQLPSQTRSELILLSNALHRHAAQDIYAPLNVPPFNRSAMDGYAVKAAQTVGASKDSPIALEVAGVITDRGLGQNTFQHLKNSLFSDASCVVPHEGRNEN